MCQSCDVWEALRRLDFVRRRALRPRLLALGLTLGEGQPRILNRLLRRGVPMTQRELAGWIRRRFRARLTVWRRQGFCGVCRMERAGVHTGLF